MDSDSEQYKAAIANVNKINAKISELGRIGKHIKLQQKIEAQTEMIKHLQFVSDSMRKAGASEHSIQVALQGMYEYLKVAHGHKLAKSSEEIIKNPDSQYDEQTIQAPVTFLSEVESQQVDWLWHKRVPLGKITILDGDPGMGK